MFRQDRRDRSTRHRDIYAAFEIVMTLSNFMAALLFVIGSICFFSEAWQTLGTWLFLVGSALFMISPALNVIREIRLAALGDETELAREGEERL